MAIETLVKTTFSDAFRDEIWQDLSAGKLMTPDFKKNVKIGDEVDVQFHDVVTLLDYTGGDLDIESVETASTTTVKVKINKGKAVFFKIDEQKVRQIEAAKTNEEKIKLVKEYSSDAREQFARAINEACCKEYVRAGHIIDNAGAAITVTSGNVHKIFAKAKVELKKGDGKGHTAWSDGNMLAIISTDMEAFLSTQNLLQYSDVMAKHYKKVLRAHLWDLMLLLTTLSAKIPKETNIRYSVVPAKHLQVVYKMISLLNPVKRLVGLTLTTGVKAFSELKLHWLICFAQQNLKQNSRLHRVSPMHLF